MTARALTKTKTKTIHEYIENRFTTETTVLRVFDHRLLHCLLLEFTQQQFDSVHTEMQHYSRHKIVAIGR